MNKRTKECDEVLTQLYDLVLNPDINDYEREPLLTAKREIEKMSIFQKSWQI